MTLIRGSALCLYLRFFSTNRKFALLCYLVGAFNVAWAISSSFLTIFKCVPVEKRWTEPTAKYCHLSLEGYELGQNVPNILGDLAAALLPIPLILKLQLSPSRKAGICATILLAFM